MSSNEIDPPDSFSKSSVVTAGGSASATQSPGTTGKPVSIAEPESIDPFTSGRYKEVDSDAEMYPQLDRPPKQHRASVGHRVSSRSSIEQLQNTRASVALLKLLPSSAAVPPTRSAGGESGYDSGASVRRHGHHRLTYHSLMKWIKKEKSRRAAHKGRSRAAKQAAHAAPAGEIDPAVVDGNQAEGHFGSPRRPSDATSEGSIALELLQDILEQNMHRLYKQPFGTSKSHLSLKKLGSIRKLWKQSVTLPDAENHDGDFSVPSCDVMLDNSKTLSYSGGLAEDSDENASRRQSLNRALSIREKDAWKTFKFELVRLAHTLKLKSWRRVPLEWSNKIEVERLSGALTNAVYVVSPPTDLPVATTEDGQPKAPVPKLLLRIYGSNVDHLIDRESELQILRRLARKHIGPRLLGTFQNGRFEEFFNARTLTAADLRVPNTSRQIAKRMRELHDGVELLDSEISAGPFVCQNIDKWMERCEKIVQWIDALLAKKDARARKLKFNGLVVAADFKLFKEALKRYRKWLEDMYGGPDGVRDWLVFAHNDAQYGNILQMVPQGESPLLLPANEHKRLVVIDFEYANANPPGLEFANHFTEWCYNYHDEQRPYACTVQKYPTVQEQKNFLYAYVSHKPSFPPAPNTPSHRLSTISLGPSSPLSGPHTPSMQATFPSVSTSLISNFMLDARNPSGSTNNASYAGSETGGSTREGTEKGEEHEDAIWFEVDRLRLETRAWRGFNSAQWVMWGVVQAKVPGLPDFDDDGNGVDGVESDGKPVGEEEERNGDVNGGEEEVEDGFDYLNYARERALFFWGDVLALGIMRPEELPAELVKEARVVDF